MPIGLSRRRFGQAASAFATLSGPALAATPPPRGLTVVELFTSQLCPGCPVADAYLIDLAKRDNLIPLSFSVTHYDHGDFKDPFGKAEFNRRQFAYAQAFKRETAFTPQMVVNGRGDAPGMAISSVEALLAGPELEGPAIMPGQGFVEIAAAPPPEVGADVWVAHYDPRLILVPIRGLEDRTLPHINVVRGIYFLGAWTGVMQRYEAPPLPSNLKRAVVVQTSKTGPIVAAARG